MEKQYFERSDWWNGVGSLVLNTSIVSGRIKRNELTEVRQPLKKAWKVSAVEGGIEFIYIDLSEQVRVTVSTNTCVRIEIEDGTGTVLTGIEITPDLGSFGKLVFADDLAGKGESKHDLNEVMEKLGSLIDALNDLKKKHWFKSDPRFIEIDKLATQLVVAKNALNSALDPDHQNRVKQAMIKDAVDGAVSLFSFESNLSGVELKAIIEVLKEKMQEILDEENETARLQFVLFEDLINGLDLGDEGITGKIELLVEALFNDVGIDELIRRLGEYGIDLQDDAGEV